MKNYTIDLLKKEDLIVFEAVMGSHAYGTNLPTSDVDIRGIFIQPLEDILGFGKVDQVSDEKNDIIYYEIGRFLDLLKSNNPNILELLCVPFDCIKINKGIMNFIFEHKDKFLTKKCRWSFGGYAVEQIRKARGLNKKMNWEENEMVRKTVLDFCYVLVGGGSKSFKEWISDSWGDNCSQKDFGLANIDHGHDLYAMYFNTVNGINWGIVSDEEIANDVQLTSIPKDLEVEGYLYFNKDGYSSHCKKFKEYQEWLEHRNETRVNMAKAHGKHYDGKNLSHCLRLLTVANEIAEGHGLIVRRSPEEIKKLIAIRQGEYEYDDIINEAESLIEKMDKTFEESNLPDNVDTEFMHELLVKIRKTWYNLDGSVYL
jgi:hypothetical protein